MKRLTTPEEMNLVRRLYPTGNHFVSLPVVDGADGSIDRAGVLHMGTASLIEFGGPQAELGAETLPPVEPLLRPFAVVDGRRLYPGTAGPAGAGKPDAAGAGKPDAAGAGKPDAAGAGALAWRRLDDWIPVWEWRDLATGLGLRGTVFAPLWRDGEGVQSYKGFVYVLEVTAVPSGVAPTAPRVGLTLTWGDLVQTVYTSRRLPAECSVRCDRWTGGPVLEPRSGAGAGPAGLAVSFSAGPDEVAWRHEAGTGGPVRIEIEARPAPGSTAGAPTAVAFYFGLNREGDGARTVAIDLARRGWERLLAETRGVLAGLRRSLQGAGTAAATPVPVPAPAAAPAEAATLEARMNLNLLFNYFFATGRTIDTEKLVLVTSRSPLYYVSAAFWARDALLWSLPGLILTDPTLAEEAVGLAFDRYFRHAGIHSLYMDGRLLYPGFELDELCAYPIALRHYVEATGDAGILARRDLVPKLRRVLDLLAAERHPDPAVHLYRTFLLPSDDPASHPYVTYDNVMAWRALLDTAALFRLAGLSGEAAGLEAEAAEVRKAVYRHCVVPVPASSAAGAAPSGKMFAWSVDLAGGSEIADEPPGSLELLAYYGFCPPDDAIWLNTIKWLHSQDNPYRYSDVPFPGLGCPHAKHPFVMSLFNALLGGRPERMEEARGVLLKAPLDNGLACESFDRETGEVKTGAAFATCAGFLGYAMHHVFSGQRPGGQR